MRNIDLEMEKIEKSNNIVCSKQIDRVGATDSILHSIRAITIHASD